MKIKLPHQIKWNTSMIFSHSPQSVSDISRSRSHYRSKWPEGDLFSRTWPVIVSVIRPQTNWAEFIFCLRSWQHGAITHWHCRLDDKSTACKFVWFLLSNAHDFPFINVLSISSSWHIPRHLLLVGPIWCSNSAIRKYLKRWNNR